MSAWSADQSAEASGGEQPTGQRVDGDAFLYARAEKKRRNPDAAGEVRKGAASPFGKIGRNLLPYLVWQNFANRKTGTADKREPHRFIVRKARDEWCGAVWFHFLF